MNDIFETEKIKLITSGRRTGRTLKLIEECAKYNYALIVCPNFNMARCTFELAREMGYNIPCPITFSQFATGKFYGKNIDAFLLDNLEITLQHLAQGVPVKTVVIMGEHELSEQK